MNLSYNYEEVVNELYPQYSAEDINSELRYFSTLTYRESKNEMPKFTYRIDDISVKKGVILKHFLNGEELMYICQRAHAQVSTVNYVINQYLDKVAPLLYSICWQQLILKR